MVRKRPGPPRVRAQLQARRPGSAWPQCGWVEHCAGHTGPGVPRHHVGRLVSPPSKVTDVPPHMGFSERPGTRWFQWHFCRAARVPGQQGAEGGVPASCLFSLGPLWPRVPRRFPVPACVRVTLEGHRPSTSVPGPCQTALGTRLPAEASSPVSDVPRGPCRPGLPFMLSPRGHAFVSPFRCGRSVLSSCCRGRRVPAWAGGQPRPGACSLRPPLPLSRWAWAPRHRGRSCKRFSFQVLPGDSVRQAEG